MEIQGINYPKDFVQLGYTTHAKSRLVERTSGQIIVAPTLLRITSKNTQNIEQNEEGLITNCIVSIDYKRNTKMFLCLSLRYPNFATVKTVYFKNAKKKRTKEGYKKWIEEKEGIYIKDVVPTPFPWNSFKEERKYPLTPKECCREGGGNTENVGDVLRNMGGEKTSRWEKLFRTIRGIFRKRTKIPIL